MKRLTYKVTYGQYNLIKEAAKKYIFFFIKKYMQQQYFLLKKKKKEEGRRKSKPYPSVILAVLFKARHAVSAAKGMALAS
jgi:hypothetical protein